MGWLPILCKSAGAPAQMPVAGGPFVPPDARRIPSRSPARTQPLQSHGGGYRFGRLSGHLSPHPAGIVSNPIGQFPKHPALGIRDCVNRQLQESNVHFFSSLVTPVHGRSRIRIIGTVRRFVESRKRFEPCVGGQVHRLLENISCLPIEVVLRHSEQSLASAGPPRYPRGA
jgi:hypothetical protein